MLGKDRKDWQGLSHVLFSRKKELAGEETVEECMCTYFEMKKLLSILSKGRGGGERSNQRTVFYMYN